MGAESVKVALRGEGDGWRWVGSQGAGSEKGLVEEPDKTRGGRVSPSQLHKMTVARRPTCSPAIVRSVNSNQPSGVKHQSLYRNRARRLSKHGHVSRVATKRRNLPLHPFQGLYLVQQSEIHFV